MSIHQHLEEGREIIKEVAIELGLPQNEALAERMLRAVLHAMRSSFTLQESFQLLEQLPVMLKVLYVDGWKYQEKRKKITHIGEFVREVIQEDWPLGHHDISTAKDGENAIKAVYKVLKRHLKEPGVEGLLIPLLKH